MSAASARSKSVCPCKEVRIENTVKDPCGRPGNGLQTPAVFFYIPDLCRGAVGPECTGPDLGIEFLIMLSEFPKIAFEIRLDIPVCPLFNGNRRVHIDYRLVFGVDSKCDRGRKHSSFLCISGIDKKIIDQTVWSL